MKTKSTKRKAPQAPEKTREQERAERLAEVGKSAYASIAEMVAGLDSGDLSERVSEAYAEALGDSLHPEDYKIAREIASKLIPEGVTGTWNDFDAPTWTADPDTEENARQRIQEDALSVEVRSDWYTPGDDHEPGEYCLLLATGGPAVRIIGALRGGEPHSARLETQDWFTPWTEYLGEEVDHDVLLKYASCFYYGAG